MSSKDADHGPHGLDAAQDDEAARQDGRCAAHEHHAVALDDVVNHLAHDRALPAAVGAVEEVSAPMEEAVLGEGGRQRPEGLDLAQELIRDAAREADERVDLEVAALEDDVALVIALERVETRREPLPGLPARPVVRAPAEADPSPADGRGLAADPGGRTPAAARRRGGDSTEVFEVHGFAGPRSRRGDARRNQPEYTRRAFPVQARASTLVECSSER